jgi:hypothetical protein
MIVADAIAYFVKDNERVFETDRSQTIGASEIGQCMKKVFALKFEHEPGMGVPRDEGYVDTWGARTRGNLIENNLLVPAIKKSFGSRAHLLGGLQRTFVDGFLSCTPDCLIEDEDGCFLVEFKTKDPRAILTEAKPEHTYQAQVQMGMLHAKSNWRPDYTIISYTNASFLNETMEFRVDRDPRIYEAAKARAATVLTADNFDDLPPEGYLAGGRECQYCPFTKACGVSRQRIPAEDSVAKADPQFVAEISDRAKQLKYVEASITMAETQKRELQYEIKERLREKGLRRVVGDGVSVSWVPVKGRESVDLEALKLEARRAGFDLGPFMRISDGGDRLTVKLKGAREAA